MIRHTILTWDVRKVKMKPGGILYRKKIKCNWGCSIPLSMIFYLRVRSGYSRYPIILK